MGPKELSDEEVKMMQEYLAKANKEIVKDITPEQAASRM
tara:strand:- start:310 stop:426 length:117 start_codon:yes stop_codon:yes gene_type:complete